MPDDTATRSCADCAGSMSGEHGNAKRCRLCRSTRPAASTLVCPRDLPCDGSPCARSSRECGWCGAHISHLGGRAEYCQLQHKKNAASKRHRERNPSYFSRYHNSPARLAWKAENLDSVRRDARMRQRAFREAHPELAVERARRWLAANQVKQRLYAQARRFRKVNNPGSVGVSERDWLRMVAIYDGCCAYCGVCDPNVHMDHVIPLVRGGRHAIGNVVPACSGCNLSKNARLLADWRYRP